MSLLAPLGLLGLLGIAILILIYIIKPNYQQKVISSTHIWKLSLKYKKKRIPINRINNILIFLCQLLILSICGLLLAGPVVGYERVLEQDEQILVLDASASMLLTNGQDTRFERAVAQAKTYAEYTLDEGGLVTIILAGKDAEVLVQRVNAEFKLEITEKLNALVEGETACTYGSANMDQAMELVEQTLTYNSKANVKLYTATNYIDKQNVEVIDVSDEDDWNVAVLDVKATLDEYNHYNIEIDTGCFGRTTNVTVYCDIYGVNGKTDKWSIHKTEYFTKGTDESKVVTFGVDEFPERVHLYSFESINVYVDAGMTDCLQADDSYFLYGGQKPTFSIQYASTSPNDFFRAFGGALRKEFKNSWNIKFFELEAGKVGETQGFDMYIFENIMPKTMPEDGIVILVNPLTAPQNAGFTIAETIGVPADSILEEGVGHPIMQWVTPSNFTVNRYQRLRVTDSDYQELMYFQGDPVALVKDTEQSKVLILSCAVNFSSFNVQHDFAFLLANTFMHFAPATFDKYVYEVGEKITFTPRGTNFTLLYPNGTENRFQDVAKQITTAIPGQYTTTQESLRLDETRYVVENFFVKIPSSESNVTKQVDSLPQIDVEQTMKQGYDDLLLYFAIALVALLFVEWMLHSREHLK